MNSCENVDFSICTLQGHLHISGSAILLSKVIGIFKCNEARLPFTTQVADEEYFKRLTIVGNKLIEKHPHTYKLVQFLKSIPLGMKFMIVSGNVIEDSSLNNYISINKQIYEINDLAFPITEGKLSTFYNIYYWGAKKVYVGEKDSQKRVCRFCGNTVFSGATFKQRAHAISESLGNKLLFCNEECDNCNAMFSVIEQDFFNIHHLFYTLYQKKGKNGLINLIGKNISIDNRNEDGVVSINADTFLPENIDDIEFEISEQSLKYSCQNIYRCLCKFAISLIDKKYIARLSETISWVRHKKTTNQLPPIWRKQVQIQDQPTFGLYVRKEQSEKDLPEFMAKLFVLDIEYLFILPFVDSSTVVLTEPAREKLNEIFDLSKYIEIDLSSEERRDMQVAFNLTLQEGSEIIYVNKTEYDSLSKKGRIDKYPNACGFYIIDDTQD